MRKKIDVNVMRCLARLRQLRLDVQRCRARAAAHARDGDYRGADQWNGEALRLEQGVLMVQANACRLAGFAQEEGVA